MTRAFLSLVFVALALVVATTRADDPPKKLTDAERKELNGKCQALIFAGVKDYRVGKLPEATRAFEEALPIVRQLYPKAEFPNGHVNLADSIYWLGFLYDAQGKWEEAEPHLKDALNMRVRLFKKDHRDVAESLDSLGSLYKAQGKLAEAELFYKDALAMYKRLFKGDHRDVAISLNNLAVLYELVRKLAEAEPLYEEALAMKRRLFKGDHLDVADGLNNLGGLYRLRGKLTEAEPLLKESLDMHKRLFKGDHRYVSGSLYNLGGLYVAQGKLTDAEPLLKETLDMNRRLYKGDHPDVAVGLGNLGQLYEDQGKLADAELLYKAALEMEKRLFKDGHRLVARGMFDLARLSMAQGKLAEAEPLLADAMSMFKRLTAAFARQKSEGDALTFSAAQPRARDAYLSLARHRAADPATGYDPGTAYSAVWATKGTIARVYEHRQLQARTADPTLAKDLDRLASTRRRRAALLLKPAPTTLSARNQRDADLKDCDDEIARLTIRVSNRLPAVDRFDRLDAATLADLQKALPADAVLVDYIRYWFSEWDNARPTNEKWKSTGRYVAFVVTRDAVKWVDLEVAVLTDSSVRAWRSAIASGKDVPPPLPAKVRELVWEKVRRELPANTKTVYVCPDVVLHWLPFAALPGDKPGTILLEDFAIATVPHAPFLLDQLWPQDPQRNPREGAVVLGGVKYDAGVAVPAPNSGAVVTARDPLVRPDQKLSWPPLENTAGEVTGAVAAAATKKLSVTQLDGDKATTTAVLAALPRAKFAHFATHGFFASPSFRSVLQVDEKDYRVLRTGERLGGAANSPLVLTGLVFAGANNPKTPGRGILTGESLIDLDLSGLELAVLSACETGLGAAAGGEGTFGLQRAFHYAGTKNVVASLWKVPDAPTAALMNVFYQNLWEKNLPPIEALRLAQLHIYRNPKSIPELAKGFRGTFQVRPGPADEGPLDAGEKAHPVKWAAFTLSGLGR